MTKAISRRDLQRQVDFLKEEINRVAAILYKHDRMVSVLLKNHPDFLSGWSYTPTITVAANHNSAQPLSSRHAPASSFEVPTLAKMCGHTMTATLLEP